MSFSLALISMPWPVYSRPSVQLGALKGFLKTQASNHQIDNYHFYLEVADVISPALYNLISQSAWIGEAVYAALLFPEKFEEIEEFLHQRLPYRDYKRNFNLKTLVSRLEDLHARHLKINWSSYGLIGFSICLAQLTSSLYLIKQIKSLYPSVPIVVGGSSCCGEMGRSLLKTFPEVDFVVQGEGELPLWHLIKAFTQKKEDLSHIKGLLWRTDQGEVLGGGYWQVNNPDQLPPPDYTDYFRTLSQLSRLKHVAFGLPIEGSRGCWWNRSSWGKPLKACRFCNLNLQWQGYRAKSPDRIVKEAVFLVKKYGSLKLYFVDNNPPKATLKEVFSRLSEQGYDLNIFLELRASVSKAELKTLRQAGVKEVQIGIEALSTSLLKRIHKGTTTIQNLQAMKFCTEFGIKNVANLIICFPGSTAEEVEETLRNIEFAMVYYPLKPVRFWLGAGSAVARYPKRFGIKRIYNHPFYDILFPKEIYQKMDFLVKDYVGDKKKQLRLWQPVIRKCKKWAYYYHKMMSLSPKPILTYQDGKDFLLIRRRLLDERYETHRLRGISRQIYLFCDSIKHIKHIHSRFPQVSNTKLQEFLADLVSKKIMFAENNRYLSLAIREESWKEICGF